MKLKAVIAIATLCLLAALPAAADTMNLGATGWDALATFSASGGHWSLTLTFDNQTSHTTDINSFAIQLFQAGSNESFSISTAELNGTSLAGSSIWRYFSDDKLNNGATPDCSTQTVKGWLCVDTDKSGTLNPQQVAKGTQDVFYFTGTYSHTSAISPLDLMASGCLIAGTCKLDGGGKKSSDGNKWAVSGPMTPPPPPRVPEPSSMVLFGSGLLTAAGVIRRRLL